MNKTAIQKLGPVPLIKKFERCAMIIAWYRENNKLFTKKYMDTNYVTYNKTLKELLNRLGA